MGGGQGAETGSSQPRSLLGAWMWPVALKKTWKRNKLGKTRERRVVSR